MRYRSWLATLLLVTSPAVFAWPAHVDHVADGDTLTVIRDSNQQKIRVRLQGIDAPEIGHGSKRRGQPYGSAAGDALRSLVSSGRVNIQSSGSRSYDRIVARVIVDGHDVGHALVRNGMAWDSTKYDRDGRYADDQEAAQSAHAGLWSQPKPIPPWKWRHTNSQ